MIIEEVQKSRLNFHFMLNTKIKPLEAGFHQGLVTFSSLHAVV